MTTATKSNVFEKSIAFSIEITKIGIRRKVDSSKIELKDGNGAQPDPDAIGVDKKLIECDEFDAIISLDTNIRNTINKIALPAPFKRGVYLLPLDFVERIDQLVQAYATKRAELISAFVEKYGEAVEASRERLGGLFNTDDYPSKATVARSFNVRYNYLDLGTPKGLGKINPEIFKREQEEFRKKLDAAAAEVRDALRGSFSELIAHMAEKLESGKDGKPKIFRDSLVLNMREFLDSFKSRNIADDSQLEALVKKARDAIGNVDANALRADKDLRETIGTQLSQIKTKLSKMVTDAPSRKFSFDD